MANTLQTRIIICSNNIIKTILIRELDICIINSLSLRSIGAIESLFFTIADH